MRKIWIVVGLLFWAITASGVEQSCYEKLGQNQDSVTYKVSADMDDGDLTVEQAKILVGRTLKLVGCDVGEIELHTFNCREIQPGVTASTACYLEAGVGYFLVVKDYVDSANVIFNRWD